MNTTIKLSENQKKAVFHKKGAILVKASAGSGKTRVLTERIKKLLSQTKRKILAITFTNKAGEEMKERLKDIPDLEKRLFIGTFHGFCQNILENHGAAIGLRTMPHIFENEADRLRLVEQAIELTPSYYERYKENDLKGKRNFCYRAFGFIAKIKRELCTEDGMNSINSDENVSLFYSSYQELLQSQNAIDFDDLILLAYQLFMQNPKIASLYRRTYEYICVDEAQDLNKAQYHFLLALTNGVHKNVMFVGDPNQSIFAFTGSSAIYMGKDYFMEQFKPVSEIELNENYRSSLKVIQAAKKIMPNVEDMPNLILKGRFCVYSAFDEKDEARWVLEKIKELLKLKNHDDIEGEISYEKIAILARTKYVFSELEELFETENIPFYYKMTPRAIKFETKSMKIFDLALRIKINPLDSYCLHCEKLSSLLNINYTTELANIVTNTPNLLDKKVLETVIDFREDGQNLKRLLNDLSEFIKTQHFDNEDEKRMLLNEIDEILLHWYQYAKNTDKKTLRQFKNAMALGQTHPLKQNEGITLSTVHTMKGQQNEIIFVIGMDDGTFPYYKAMNSGGLEMVQEKNNAYVAFTRAQRFLYVSWPASRNMPWGNNKKRNISRLLSWLEQSKEGEEYTPKFK